MSVYTAITLSDYREMIGVQEVRGGKNQPTSRYLKFVLSLLTFFCLLFLHSAADRGLKRYNASIVTFSKLQPTFPFTTEYYTIVFFMRRD